MDKLVRDSTSVSFSEEERGQELSLSWRTGVKSKTGVYVYLTPVLDGVETGCSEGSLSGGTLFDEPDDPEYIQWEGTRYGLAEGNVDVKATVFKVFSGTASLLKVDMEKLEITSTTSFMGVVKITKNNQSMKYLWSPASLDAESTTVVWAYYEKTDAETKKVTKSSAVTQLEWPPADDVTTISLSVGRQDTKEGCIYVYQTPNSRAVERGTDKGSLESDGIVNNKEKDIFTVWTGNSISLPDGCISCGVTTYKVYDGSSGGISVNLSEGVATSKNEWNGIVKLTTVTESKKLKWIPPDVDKRTQAVIHAYRKGKVSMVNVEWVPNKTDTELRLELGSKGSKEGTDVPLKEIKIRLYPPLDDATLGCTAGSVTRRNKIIEDKEKYLEFQLVPLRDIHGTDEIAWEPDDPVDSSNVSKESMGKNLLGVAFEIISCFNSDGESVEPSIYYDEDSGNAVGDQSFYGLVKATYQEEYQEIIYQQAYMIKDNGVMSIQDAYVYARMGEKVTYLEVPWDTNVTHDRKEFYSVYSYYVRSAKGTFEYPDNWLSELEGEVKNLDKKTYSDWETLLESRETGIFAKDPTIEVPPANCAIEQRIHRTAQYDFLGNLVVDNAQPIWGTYFKPYTDMKPSPTSTYKPKYFVKFAEPPEVYDGRDEFGEEDYATDPENVGKGSLYIPSDESKEEFKKAWTATYLRFNQDKFFESLQKEFPGLIRIPAEPKAAP